MRTSVFEIYRSEKIKQIRSEINKKSEFDQYKKQKILLFAVILGRTHLHI